MKNFKYLAATALITISACDNQPQPNEQAQNAKPSYAVQVEVPQEGFIVTQDEMEMIQAIKENNVRRVKAILDNKNVSPSAPDADLRTALMLAADSNPEMLEAVLKHVKQNDSVVLDRGDNDGKSAIIYATDKGSAEMVVMLREKGANPNILDKNNRFPLLIAASNNYNEVVHALLKDISGTVPANPKLQNSSGENAIIAATKTGNLELVKILKDYGADINAANTEGFSPLTHAVAKNDIQLVDNLLELGADINSITTTKTPLIHAIEAKNHVMAKHLLDKGADVNAHSPQLASALQTLVSQENADPELASRLIAGGAKLSADGEPPSLLLSRAIRKGNAPVVKLLIEKGLKVSDLESPTKNGLIEALEADEPEVALLMINNGANVAKTNEQGFSALAIAGRKGYSDVFKALIAKGADVNQTSRNSSAVPLEIVIESDNAELLEIMFQNGLKASPDAILLRAVGGKSNKLVPVVLKNGAKPNIMNTAGQPALWLATARDNNEAAKTLVDAGALLDVADNEKSITPLSLAIARANMDLANYFLDKGAKPDIVDRNGFTSLTYAVIAGQSEMVSKLISKGAVVKVVDNRNKTIMDNLNESKINPQKKQEIKAILAAAGAK